MISFIVPAYNEERLLGPTLDALHAAAQAVGESYELVVVDDGSTDRTASSPRTTAPCLSGLRTVKLLRPAIPELARQAVNCSSSWMRTR